MVRSTRGRAASSNADRVSMRSTSGSTPTTIEYQSGGIGITQRLLRTSSDFPEDRQPASTLGRISIEYGFVDQVLDQGTIEVITSEIRISFGREHAEDRLTLGIARVRRYHFEHGDIEGPPSEVIDDDGLRRSSGPDAVGQRRRRGLVENPDHLEPRETSRISRRLSLSVVEVRRHRDHRAPHRPSQNRRSLLAEMREEVRGDLLRGADSTVDLHACQTTWPRDDGVWNHQRFRLSICMASTHESLDAEDGSSRMRFQIRCRLGADRLDDVTGISNHRRHEIRLIILRQRISDPENARTSRIGECNQRVRGSQINSHDQVDRIVGSLGVI